MFASKALSVLTKSRVVKPNALKVNNYYIACIYMYTRMYSPSMTYQ
jgi:hypothetical protein